MRHLRRTSDISMKSIYWCTDVNHKSTGDGGDAEIAYQLSALNVSMLVRLPSLPPPIILLSSRVAHMRRIYSLVNFIWDQNTTLK